MFVKPLQVTKKMIPELMGISMSKFDETYFHTPEVRLVMHRGSERYIFFDYDELKNAIWQVNSRIENN